jgi:alpha-galactosidase
VFLNAGGEDQEMSATLAEIFVHDGPEGSATQVKEARDVYDLWADRMDDEVAQQVFDATRDEEFKKDANWYNVTAMPYKQGLKNGDERLLGKKVSKIAAGGTLATMVKSHSAEMFRLRSLSGVKRKVDTKEEL